MILIISGNLDYQESKNVKVIDKICNLSDIKKKNVDILIIDDCIINDDGCIKVNDNMIYLDEILIMKKVKYIIVSHNAKYVSNKAFEKIKEIGNYYKLNLIFIK